MKTLRTTTDGRKRRLAASPPSYGAAAEQLRRERRKRLGSAKSASYSAEQKQGLSKLIQALGDAPQSYTNLGLNTPLPSPTTETVS